jgi:hypothetical protein
MILPTHQKVERTITINAPAKEIFDKIDGLSGFPQVAVWFDRDSTSSYKIVVPEATEGYAVWKGDPNIAGEGKVVLLASEPGKYVKHKIYFIKPKKNEAESTITLNESNGATTVTWEFVLSTPRPWNIYNLLHSIDKEFGPDFEEGLANLKKSFEGSTASTTASNAPEVQQLNFPATTFAIARQLVKWEDAPQYLIVNWDMLSRATNDSTPKKNATFVYNRDEKTRQSDLAAAIEVPQGTKLENNIIQVIDIPDSKAVYIDYNGPMQNASEKYPVIRKYLADNDLKQTGPIILTFVNTGSVRIIFLVE